MSRPRLARPALLAVACLVATALVGVAPAQAASRLVFPSNAMGGNVATGDNNQPRCAAMTSKAVTGTLVGADGLDINATIGFDMLDKAGRKIDVETGCPVKNGAYGAVVQLNHFISGQGAPEGTEMFNKKAQYTTVISQGFTSPNWEVDNLPANVVSIYVEAYSRTYTGSPCGLPCAGTVDTSKYGFVNRRQLKPGNATLNLKLVAPITQRYGGSAGSMVVTIPSGRVDFVRAFSAAKDGQPVSQGWGIGGKYRGKSTVFNIPALAGNQAYTLDVSVNGIERKMYGIKVKNDTATKVKVKL